MGPAKLCIVYHFGLLLNDLYTFLNRSRPRKIRRATTWAATRRTCPTTRRTSSSSSPRRVTGPAHSQASSKPSRWASIEFGFLIFLSWPLTKNDESKFWPWHDATKRGVGSHNNRSPKGPSLKEIHKIVCTLDPPCHCHTHKIYQYYCLLLDWPPFPSQRMSFMDDSKRECGCGGRKWWVASFSLSLRRSGWTMNLYWQSVHQVFPLFVPLQMLRKRWTQGYKKWAWC